MAKRKNLRNARTPEEIQESGNILLNNKLEAIREKYPELKIIITSEEHQKDRGVDFQIELIRKPNEITIEMFKLQVKATDETVIPLERTINKGMISFQIDNRHVRYYQKELPYPLLFILCDNKSKKVYWYPIQLDNTLDDRLNRAIVDKKKSLQIFINPKNILEPESFIDFINDAEDSKLWQFFRVSAQNENSLTASKEFQIDRSLPLLEQLYNVMEYLYEEVQFVPIHLLNQYYPFKISDKTSHYLQFKLYTYNDDLVAMLDTFEVQLDGSIKFTNSDYTQNVDNYEKKAKDILSKFSQNHIYAIVSNISRKEVSTRYFNHSDCNCVVCCYNRLEIPQAIEKLGKRKDTTLEEKMTTAYMHYVLGNYLKAAQAFEAIGKNAYENKKKTLFMITQFNLIKLGKLIKINYFEAKIRERWKRLLEINLDVAEYVARNRSHHRKLFNYIKETRFYSNSAFEIQNAMSKLRNEYQSFIEGGNFNTHSYNQLLNGFAQLNSFIGGNRIVYDQFGEFRIQMEEFTEGIFIALALRETNSQVISEFNDYHIQRLIFDGDHKMIWRYFNKYHFKSITYNVDKGKFFEMISNLLANHHLFNDTYKNYAPEEGSFWRNRYSEIFNNCLSLAAMLQMNDSQAEKISKEIKDCISKWGLPNPETYVQVNSFFASKRSQLSTDLLKELIFFFLQKDDMYLEKRLSILISELKLRKEFLSFSSQQKKLLFEFALDGKNDKLEYFNTLIYFYPIVDNSMKKEIKKSIIYQLNKKFEVYNYYNSAIYDVLPFQESEFLDKFIEVTYPDPSKYSIRNSLYGPQDNEYPLFDMFLNLCFKYDLQPNAISNKNFRGFGYYYDWLHDLEGFDYGKFKISWIGLYPTKFYLNHFAKSKKLEKAIKKYLRNNRDQKIERLYFDIYNPQMDELEELF